MNERTLPFFGKLAVTSAEVMWVILGGWGGMMFAAPALGIASWRMTVLLSLVCGSVGGVFALWMMKALLGPQAGILTAKRAVIFLAVVWLSYLLTVPRLEETVNSTVPAFAATWLLMGAGWLAIKLDERDAALSDRRALPA
jgi:hypothetical protein